MQSGLCVFRASKGDFFYLKSSSFRRKKTGIIQTFCVFFWWIKNLTEILKWAYQKSTKICTICFYDDLLPRKLKHFQFHHEKIFTFKFFMMKFYANLILTPPTSEREQKSSNFPRRHRNHIFVQNGNYKSYLLFFVCLPYTN